MPEIEDRTIYRPEFLIDELREAISDATKSDLEAAEVDAILLGVLKALIARKVIRLVVAPGVGEE